MKTDKKSYTLEQLTDFACEEMVKWSEAEKAKAREILNWEFLYNRLVDWSVIH